MKSFAALLILTTGITLAAAQSTASKTKTPEVGTFQASPEMRRLLDAFAGEWNVKEVFEIHPTKQGSTREGMCSIQAGPGVSLVENCRTNGSAGELQFVAVLWWDPKAEVYQFFTCANASGCELRGTARWQGSNLVNSWDEEHKGKRVFYRDSFIDLSPNSFTLASEGVSENATVWRVVTKYARRPAGQQQAKSGGES